MCERGSGRNAAEGMTPGYTPVGQVSRMRENVSPAISLRRAARKNDRVIYLRFVRVKNRFPTILKRGQTVSCATQYYYDLFIEKATYTHSGTIPVRPKDE